MKKLLRILGSLFVLGSVLTAVTYFLQKRGILRVAVNYDTKDGTPVTRELDEIVETAVGSTGQKVGNKVAEMASDVKESIARQLDAVTGQLSREENVSVPDDAVSEFDSFNA